MTLGSSRVGDLEFAALFADANVRRFVDCCDIITRLPSKVLGYEHVGKDLYIAQDGAVPANPSQDFIQKDRSSARWAYVFRYAWRFGNVWSRDAADHAPSNYVSAILGEREN